MNNHVSGISRPLQLTPVGHGAIAPHTDDSEARARGNCEERVVTVSPATEINESMGPGTSGVPGDLTRHFRGTREAEAR